MAAVENPCQTPKITPEIENQVDQPVVEATDGLKKILQNSKHLDVEIKIFAA